MNVDFIRWTFGLSGPEYTFWHNCPGGDCHLLDVGTEFDVVFSPLDFQPVKAWKKTRFKVVEYVETHGAHKGEWIRGYHVVRERALTDAEAGAYWAMGEWERLGKVA